MNKAYNFINDKAIVIDENGNCTQTEYYDNLHNVLVEENLIETIEKEIENLKDQKTNINSSKSIKKYIPLASILVFLTILILPMFIGGNSIFINSIFGKVNLLSFTKIFLGTFFIPIALTYDYMIYSAINQKIKTSTSIDYKIDYLNKKLVEERQKLDELKNNKINTEKDSTLKFAKVNDVEKLKQLKHYLELYGYLGYDTKKLYKYLEKGNLEKKLSKYCDNEDIELAKIFLEEKGPKLVKKKN